MGIGGGNGTQSKVPMVIFFDPLGMTDTHNTQAYNAVSDFSFCSGHGCYSAIVVALMQASTGSAGPGTSLFVHGRQRGMASRDASSCAGLAADAER